MKKIIVTGGTGYIGSHTTVELQMLGYEVIILDNLSNSHESFVQRIEKITGVLPRFHQVDICDKEVLFSVLAQYSDEIHGIIHFAALKAVGESISNPLIYYKNNIGGLLNILEVMDVYDIPHIIFSSSATVYGQPSVLPATEETPIQEATSPYGYTKQMGESILKDFIHSSQDKNAISLRYFNPIGAHSSGHIGELPQGIPNNLMPFITQTAAGLRPELKVYGDDYNTKDGTAIRDYIHVVDLAKAHTMALKRLLDGKAEKTYEVYNLGTGLGYTVLEVIKSFEKTTGLKLKYSIASRRDGDIEAIYASTQKANTVLGWSAEKSIDDMTASHWNWEKSYRNV